MSTTENPFSTFVRELLTELTNNDDKKNPSPPSDDPEEDESTEFALHSSLPVLDLTERSKLDNSASSLFGSHPWAESLVDSVCRGLCREPGHHVLLVGEPGVGKELLLDDMARRAVHGRLPPLEGRRLIQVFFRPGTTEETYAQLFAVLTSFEDTPDVVVVLDGLGSIDLGQGNRELTKLLIGQLDRTQSKYVLLLTPREADSLFSTVPEKEKRFTTIHVEEPDRELSEHILSGLTADLETAFDITIDRSAVQQAVLLTSRYLLDDRLPGKAFELLRRLCQNVHFDREHLGKSKNTILSDDVVSIVSLRSGIPTSTLEGVGSGCDYSEALRATVVGQGHAVEEVAAELDLIVSGAKPIGKPASVMLFLGQTGTGKTEMAKALARIYSSSKKPKTYALGNCVEQHSVATLIGVPPGYVGHDEGGRLVNELNADPYGVLLLDEADKAHPDVLQPFLNLFDEGWISDQRGIRAYADHAIVILTSNVGQRMIGEMFGQGKSIVEITTRMREALSQIRHTKTDRPVFTPEFLARLDRIIVFRPLDVEAMQGIARNHLGSLQEEWRTRRRKTLTIDDKVIERVGVEAHELDQKSKGKEGGRIVRKLIADQVELPLQRAINERPSEYKSCSRVLVATTKSSTEKLEVVIDFQQGEADPQS